MTSRSGCAFAVMIAISTAPVMVSRVAFAHFQSPALEPPDRAAIDHRVAEALKRFKEGDLETRLNALSRLAVFAPLAAPAIPDLIAALDDPEPKIRSHAAYLLGSIGPAAKEAVPALIRLLRNPREPLHSKTRTYVFDCAATALVQIVPDRLAILPELMTCLRKNPDRYRNGFVSAIGRIGAAAIPAIIDLLKDKDRNIRLAAVETLGRFNSEARSAIPALIEALRSDDDGEIRDHISAALAQIGDEAVTQIVELLKSPEIRVRARAVRALGFCPQRDVKFVPKLIELLKDPDLRFDAASSLSSKSFDSLHALNYADESTRTATLAAIPVLIAELKDPDPMFRKKAAETIEGILHDDFYTPAKTSSGTRLRIAAAESLKGVLGDPDRRVRIAALGAIGEIGKDARRSFVDVWGLLRDKNDDVRQAALKTIGRINGDSAENRALLVAALDDADPVIRATAMNLINDEAFQSLDRLERLFAALKDRTDDVRHAAVQKIHALYCQSHSGLQGYHVEADEKRRRPATARALIHQACSDTDARVRREAMLLLPIFEPDSSKFLPALVAGLGDRDLVVRLAAAQSLASIGDRARPVVKELIAAIDDLHNYHPSDINQDEFTWQDFDSIPGYAFEALLNVNQASPDLIDRLIARLGDPRDGVFHGAKAALLKLGDRADSILLKAFGDPKTPEPVKQGILAILEHQYYQMITQMDLNPSPSQPKEIDADRKAAIPELVRIFHAARSDKRIKALKVLIVVDSGGPTSARAALDIARDDGYDQVDFSWSDPVFSEEAFPALIEGLKDSSEDVRVAAIEALAELDMKLPYRNARDYGENPEPAELEACKRGRALREQATDALIPLLKDRDTQVRWYAAWCLGILGIAEKSLPPLIAMIEDQSSCVRKGARITLSSPHAGKIYNICRFPSQGEKLRIAAIQGVSDFGPQASGAVPALIEALKDDQMQVRYYALGALEEIGAEARGAIPALAELLRSNVAIVGPPVQVYFMMNRERIDYDLGGCAASALGAMGKPAIAPLLDALKTKDPRLRGHVAYALYRITQFSSAIDEDETEAQLRDRMECRKAVVEPLMAAFKGKDEEASAGVETALESLGDEVYAELIALLDDRSSAIREKTARLLGRIAVLSSESQYIQMIIEELRKRLSDPDPAVRGAIEEAIRIIDDHRAKFIDDSRDP